MRRGTNRRQYSERRGARSWRAEFGFTASNWIGGPRRYRAVDQANLDTHGFVGECRADVLRETRGSPIQSVADFKGKRIAIARRAGAWSSISTRSSVYWESLSTASRGGHGLRGGADALIVGAIDVQFHPLIPNKVLTVSASVPMSNRSIWTGANGQDLGQVPFYRPVVMERMFFVVSSRMCTSGVINVIVTHERIAERSSMIWRRRLPEPRGLLNMNLLFKGLKHLFERAHASRTALQFGGVALHRARSKLIEKCVVEIDCSCPRPPLAAVSPSGRGEIQHESRSIEQVAQMSVGCSSVDRSNRWIGGRVFRLRPSEPEKNKQLLQRFVC